MVAVAGDLSILQYEFAYFVNMMGQYSGYGDAEQLRDTAIKETAYFRTLVSKATEMGLTLSEDDMQTIDGMLTQMIPYYAMMAGVSEEEYVQGSFGVSLEEYSMLINDMMLCDRLTYELMEQADATDEETKALYENDPDRFNSVTVRHVLFLYEGTDEQNPRTQEESKKLAEETLERIKNGEDIGDLAAELTDDTASASTGGEYTFTHNDSFVDEFKDWAFEAEVGDTGIVETMYGYHVMQLDKKLTTFDDLKDDVAQAIKQDYVIALFDEWRNDPAYTVTIVNQELYDSVG
jgi:hypothetical protein